MKFNISKYEKLDYHKRILRDCSRVCKEDNSSYPEYVDDLGDASSTGSLAISSLMKPLTADDYEIISERADFSLKKASYGVRGQTINPSDFIDWHIMHETRRYLLERVEKNLESEND